MTPEIGQGVVFLESTDYTIIADVTNDPVLNADDQVGEIIVESGGLLTISSNYKLTASSVNLKSGGTIDISNGELECTGKMDADGTLIMSGGILDVNGEFELSSTSAETISGGTIYCAGDWDGRYANNYTLTAGTVVLDGGSNSSSEFIRMDDKTDDGLFTGNSYFNDLTISGYTYIYTYHPYIKGNLTILNGGELDSHGERFFRGESSY